MYKIKDVDVKRLSEGIYQLSGSIDHPLGVNMAISSIVPNEETKAITFTYGASIEEAGTNFSFSDNFVKPIWVEKVIVKADNEEGQEEDEFIFILE